MMGPRVRVTNTVSGWLVPISSLSTEGKVYFGYVARDCLFHKEKDGRRGRMTELKMRWQRLG
jgi:hypothetical protein